MSKKLISVIVAVLIIAGIAGFVVYNNNKDDNSKSNASSTSLTSSAQKSTQTSTSGSIFSLAEAGKAQKCTFTYTGTSGTGTGTMYSNGKGGGLMTLAVTTSEGKTLTSNTLLSGDKVYSWTTTNGQTIGFVADKSIYTTPKSTATTTQPSSVTQDSEASKSYKVKCVGWSVDQAMLTPPTNVTFQTLPSSTTPQ